MARFNTRRKTALILAYVPASAGSHGPHASSSIPRHGPGLMKSRGCLCKEVLSGVMEEGTSLEGLRCGFGGPMNQRGSVETRDPATLPPIEQVAEDFQDSPMGKHCRREREKVTKTWSESIAESFQKAPGQ